MKVIEIPREETRTVMEYQCPACLFTYSHKQMAERCLDRHGGKTVMGGEPGDTLTIDDGEFQREAHTRVSHWVENVIDVGIVEDELSKERYLFQRENGSRDHVRYRKVLKLAKA